MLKRPQPNSKILPHEGNVKFPTPGDRVAGRYDIETVIGQGGFSRIYRARQAGLDRLVALKVLKPRELVGGPQDDEDFSRLEQRFVQEAKLISRLKDRATVIMYDYGATPDGLLYMVLEYVDGLTLKELIRNTALSPERAVKIIGQILTSLQEAHSLGVLHRDIKPANIMVYEHAGRTDLVKVLDFGIAKVIAESNASLTLMNLTRQNTVIGTPRYMSPERVRGLQLRPASDIYNVGLVAFELLAGRRAIEVDDPVEIMDRHLDAAPITLPADCDVPERLREIVHRMLRKELSLRYPTCEEALADLERWDEIGEDDTTRPASPVLDKSDPTLRFKSRSDALPPRPHQPLSPESEPPAPDPPHTDSHSDAPPHTESRQDSTASQIGSSPDKSSTRSSGREKTAPSSMPSNASSAVDEYPIYLGVFLIVAVAIMTSSFVIYHFSKSDDSRPTVHVTANDEALPSALEEEPGPDPVDERPSEESSSMAFQKTLKVAGKSLDAALLEASDVSRKTQVDPESEAETKAETVPPPEKATSKASTRKKTSRTKSADRKRAPEESSPPEANRSPGSDSRNVDETKQEKTNKLDEDNSLGIFGIE